MSNGSKDTLKKQDEAEAFKQSSLSEKTKTAIQKKIDSSRPAAADAAGDTLIPGTPKWRKAMENTLGQGAVTEEMLQGDELEYSEKLNDAGYNIALVEQAIENKKKELTNKEKDVYAVHSGRYTRCMTRRGHVPVPLGSGLVANPVRAGAHIACKSHVPTDDTPSLDQLVDEEQTLRDDLETLELRREALIDDASSGTLDVAKWLAGQQALEQKKQQETVREGTLEAAAIYRFQEQCFLIQHIMEILGTTRATYRGYKNGNASQWMDDDSALFISKIFGIPDVDPLLRGKASDYGRLVPKIAIYKIYPNIDNGGTPREVMLPFSTFTDKNTVAGMMEDASYRGDDVGLKSFNFSFKNNNIALAKRLVECKIELVFQSARSLHTQRGTDDESFKYIDLFLRAGEESRRVPVSERVFHRDYYRIKAVVGWQVPPYAHVGGPPDYMSDDFKRSVRRAKIVLNLELKDYDLDFREDGSLVVTLNYVSYIESILAGPEFDIFERVADKIKEEQKSSAPQKIQDTLKAKQEQIQEALDAPGSLSPATIAAATRSIEKLEEESEIAGKKLEAWRYRTLMGRYRQLLSEMHDRVYVAEVKVKDIIAEFTHSADRSRRFVQSEAMSRKRQIQGRDPQTGTWGPVERTGGLNPRMPKIHLRGGPGGNASMGAHTKDGDRVYTPSAESYLKAMDTAVKEVNEEAYNPDSADDEPEEKRKQRENRQLRSITPRKLPKKGEDVEVAFFLFGDLIDSILKGSLGEKLIESDVHLIYGPITIVDYYTDEPRVINIADIPISMQLFLEFVHQKIIKPQIDRYPIHSFLRDAFNYLIAPAVGEACFAGASGNTKFEMQIISATKNANGKDRVKPGRVRGSDISPESEDTILIENDYTPVTNMMNYVIISADQDLGATNLCGDMGKDVKNGIHHLFLGSETGILRSAKFKKMKMKYAPEMLTQRSISGEESKGVQLWHKYNAELSLIGTPMFRPGQMIYVNVDATGLGPTGARVFDGQPWEIYGPGNLLSPSALLGLGGYYLVIGSENAISKEGWSNTITAIWQGRGECIEGRARLYDPAKSAG